MVVHFNTFQLILKTGSLPPGHLTFQQLSMVSQGEVTFKIPVVTKTRSLDSPESGMRQEQYLRRTKDIGGEKNRRKKQLLAGYYSVQAIGPVTSDYHSQE